MTRHLLRHDRTAAFLVIAREGEDGEGEALEAYAVGSGEEACRALIRGGEPDPDALERYRDDPRPWYEEVEERYGDALDLEAARLSCVDREEVSDRLQAA